MCSIIIGFFVCAKLVWDVFYFYFYFFLKVYRYEKADGAGRAQDLIVQGFIRFATMGILPVVFSAGVLYLLVRYGCTATKGGREGEREYQSIN